jgi:hypothetical protein
MVPMAVKFALAALVSFGLSIVGIAAVDVVLAESTASAASTTAINAECSCGPGDTSAECLASERRGHIAWNATSWLVGLGLVLVATRRGQAEPTLD